MDGWMGWIPEIRIKRMEGEMRREDCALYAVVFRREEDRYM